MSPRHKFHLRVVPNVGDIVPLISKYIVESPGPADVKVQQEAMKCFQVCPSSYHNKALLFLWSKFLRVLPLTW
jgi:hypothetical protein